MGAGARSPLLQIEKLSNVTIYPASKLTAADVLEFGAPHVVIATGASWRRDGSGRGLLPAAPGLWP